MNQRHMNLEDFFKPYSTTNRIIANRSLYYSTIPTKNQVYNYKFNVLFKKSLYSFTILKYTTSANLVNNRSLPYQRNLTKLQSRKAFDDNFLLQVNTILSLDVMPSPCNKSFIVGYL